MREGELFGLRKQDVNWKTNEITVRRSWDAETTKSRRDLVIPIARDLMPYLRAAFESSDSELLFPNREGRMHGRNLHVNERIRTPLKAAGSPLERRGSRSRSSRGCSDMPTSR
jgi:integrase